jgi:hypothetical protein
MDRSKSASLAAGYTSCLKTGLQNLKDRHSSKIINFFALLKGAARILKKLL